MKKLKLFLGITFLTIFCSCSPRISTSLSKNYPPLDYRQKVVVIDLDQPKPNNSEELGQIKVGDSGFSTKCNYETVVDKAKLEARKVGGNAIKITKHKTPDLWSTCHRITAIILKVEDIENLETN
ncbi:hypothetical protein SAMN05444274_1227 [Mariniphaga anaerophila]|uniref:Lipoprotein n=1 Tax=Mariniphaga anaerophila TaxID=1484053 RepID=A0A1M5GHC4_9BACT|nr:hypothetical protein [Mariniphaga anaerophila]SHG03088.1 hypothetical protein SAMN05444274_1227 [Mariniphaga anaerophila]